MAIDFSKHKVGSVVRVHVCDGCYRSQIGNQPKDHSESGTESWPCDVCGQYNIGIMADCVIGDWLSLRVIKESGQ
jgi:hypothetical protein